jgi:serine/threonine protein kinase
MNGVPHAKFHSASGGDLAGMLKSVGRMAEPAARLCFHSIVSALSYLHANNVLHRGLSLFRVIRPAVLR